MSSRDSYSICSDRIRFGVQFSFATHRLWLPCPVDPPIAAGEHSRFVQQLSFGGA